MKKYIFLFFMLVSKVLYADISEGEALFNAKNYSQAYEVFFPLANQGDPRAQYYLGYMYLKGLGKTANSEMALHFLNKAAKQEYEMAQSLLGYMYFEGVGVPVDKKKAVSFYEKAARKKEPAALLNLGVLYYTGDYYFKNQKKAFEYFSAISSDEYPVVWRYLGDMYLNGEGGLSIDTAKALENYEKAAVYGDDEAYFNIGVLHQKINNNSTKAMDYFLYAATKNIKNAQYLLGAMYVSGLGVPKDVYKGYAWLSLVGNSVEGAEEMRSKIYESMTVTDIEQARKELIAVQKLILAAPKDPLSDLKVKKKENDLRLQQLVSTVSSESDIISDENKKALKKIKRRFRSRI